MAHWSTRAACVGADPDVLYSERRYHRHEHPAVQLCRGCPVKDECLTDALALGPFGQFYVRGGLTPVERRELLRRVA